MQNQLALELAHLLLGFAGDVLAVREACIVDWSLEEPPWARL